MSGECFHRLPKVGKQGFVGGILACGVLSSLVQQARYSGNSRGSTPIMTSPMMICKGRPTLM